MDKCTQSLVIDFSLSGFSEFTDCTGKGAKGVARSGYPRARFAQNGSIGGAALLPLRACSRDLMRDFAARVLCWNRYDSLPVSTIWQ